MAKRKHTGRRPSSNPPPSFKAAWRKQLGNTLDAGQLDKIVDGEQDFLTDAEVATIMYSTIAGHADEAGTDTVAIEHDLFERVVQQCWEWRVGIGVLDSVLLGAIHIMDVYDDGTFKIKLSQRFAKDSQWLTRVAETIEARHSGGES